VPTNLCAKISEGVKIYSLAENPGPSEYNMEAVLTVLFLTHPLPHNAIRAEKIFH
jgi:hypothetical protein